MKKTLFVLFSIFLVHCSYSQDYILPNDIVTDFVKTTPSKIVNSDVLVSAKVDSDNLYEITIDYSGIKKVFKLKPLTFPSFQTKFKSVFSELLTEVNEKKDGTNAEKKLELNTPINPSADNKIALLFTQIVSRYNTEEERPQIATLHLKKDINVYYYDPNNKPKNNNKTAQVNVGVLSNPQVEISFYAGFIEKIQVNGTINGQEVSFNNKFSIGISATKNIRELSDNILYTNEQFTKEFILNENKSGTPDQINKVTDRSSLYINVGDVIRYVKRVDVNANDISPVPQLVILDKNQNESKLYKEESTKLFEAIVYTDFFGIFDEENPNGIIQTEITKRFNIETSRFDSGSNWYGLLFPPLLVTEGVGFFQFFDARFQYSKIEKNNKFLLPANYETLDSSGTVISNETYYAPIALYQHRNFAIGGNLNLLTLENQNAKLNMYLNTGFLFGRSGVKENETQENGTYINNIEIPIEYKFHLLPEKRVSFEFGAKASWFELLDSEINLKSIEENKLTSKNKWLNSFNLDVNVDVSSTGKLFLRYKLIHELDNINNNFSQLQFGYSFFLLQNNVAKKDKSLR